MSAVAIANSIVFLVASYVVVGLAFALAFVSIGIRRVDHVADGSGIGFRALILPGTVALWPLLAVRWARGASQPIEHNAHRDAANRGQSL